MYKYIFCFVFCFFIIITCIKDVDFNNLILFVKIISTLPLDSIFNQLRSSVAQTFINRC